MGWPLLKLCREELDIGVLERVGIELMLLLATTMGITS